MKYQIMQQRHLSITAIRTSDDDFTSLDKAKLRQNELKGMRGVTHFFWIRVIDL